MVALYKKTMAERDAKGAGEAGRLHGKGTKKKAKAEARRRKGQTFALPGRGNMGT